MTESALPRPGRFPWLVPAVLGVVVVGVLVAVLLLARAAGTSEAPPPAGAFVPPGALPYTAYDVERSEGGKLKLTTGGGRDASSLDLDLPAGTRVWLLDTATPADLKPPLVVNVIAIPNEVRNYTITLMAFAPLPAGASAATPQIPLADGYYGYEASRDPRERAVVSAILESFDGRNGVTRDSAGSGTLFVDEGAPVRLLRAGAPGDIEPGDRIAVRPGAGGVPDVSQGVLVLTGGAR